MESLLDRSNGLLNPQQPLKVDDRQNLFTSTLGIGAVDHINQSNGAGLNHTVQSAIDKWAGKQAINITSPSNSPIANSNLSKSAGISVVQAPVTKQYYSALAASIKVAPAAIKIPADIAPTGLVINGVKSSYDVGSTLSIDPSFVVDSDGWKDISKVDFWLTDSKGKRFELDNATSFVAKDLKDKNSAKFSYSTSLRGTAAGNYKLNAVAYDKFGAKGNQFSKSIEIKPFNFAPDISIRTGKTTYEANSILSIDIGNSSDKNGWQDIKKVDFWLTNSQNKRIELDDVNTFIPDDQASTYAKFNYSTSLRGLDAGDYKLNAVAYDKVGAKSNQSTSSFKIKPINSAPQTIVIPKIKEPGYYDDYLSVNGVTISDKDGWQDIKKVDFWLTNSQNKRIELDDVSFLDSLVLWSGQNIDSNSIKFDYKINTNNFIPGSYKLNAVAYDQSGAASSQFTQPDEIKVKNFIPNEGMYDGYLLNHISSKSSLPGGIKSIPSFRLFNYREIYKANSILMVNDVIIRDENGWQDIEKVDFWLTDSKGLRVELRDANNFTNDSSGAFSKTARFSYNTSLEGIALGDYTLNATAYDRSGAKNIQSKREITIEAANTAPYFLVINGVKSNYSANSTLTIDPSFVFDDNGSKDIRKVDFWLTDDQGKQIELDRGNFGGATFIDENSTDEKFAKFNYSKSLSRIAAGSYKFNAVAYDSLGSPSNQFVQSISIGLPNNNLGTVGKNLIEGTIGSALNGSTYKGILKRVDGKSIEEGKPTWLVVHGMNGNAEGDILNLALSIDSFEANDNLQVLTLDWSQAAASPFGLPIPTTGASFISATAQFAVNELKKIGIDGSLLSIAGHSLGAYVGYEMSKKFGEVKNLVALDPATNTVWGYTEEQNLNLSQYSQWSWGFYSSWLGQDKRVQTADESFNVKVQSNTFNPIEGLLDAPHGAGVKLWANMLQNKQDKNSSYFGLNKFSIAGKPWGINSSGWEEEIITEKDVNGNWIIKLLVSPT